MKGAVRLPTPSDPTSFPEGFDDARISYWRTEGGTWMIHLPPRWLGTLVRHDVVEHEDGTITVSPSIKITQPGGKAGGRHGFLRRGVWEPCGDDHP